MYLHKMFVEWNSKGQIKAGQYKFANRSYAKILLTDHQLSIKPFGAACD